MGLDGFALNIGDPSQAFVRQTMNYMFDYTRDTYGDKFHLFVSMDVVCIFSIPPFPIPNSLFGLETLQSLRSKSTCRERNRDILKCLRVPEAFSSNVSQ